MSGQLLPIGACSGINRRAMLSIFLLAAAAPELAAEDILDRAIAAAGGAAWRDAKTLYLEGSAVFYGPSGAAPRSRADSYRMWRVFDPGRTAAHGAEGKVRILACSGPRRLFTVGFDGQTTWTERGITPPAEAEAFWASNFGFGIIRHARGPGFRAERVADDRLDGHRLHMVRLTDPQGGITLFGIDANSFAIRSMGFASPRGWHVRTYGRFFRPPGTRWMQAGLVTLYYNGVKANEVIWRRARVDAPIDASLFAPQSKEACPGA
jgi:hypothetical protein